MLQISTLGGLSICLDGEPVIGLASRKVEALLAYLACNPRQHPREVLAEMFWAERAQSQAMSNLRVALSSLRKHLQPFVVITRDTVSINSAADPSAGSGQVVWLDVAEFEQKLDIGKIEEAVALYQGDFLEGFYVRGCPGFEDWASVERERLYHTVVDVLQGLVESTIAQGRFQDGIGYASQMLQLDPLSESAYQQMMVLLAHSGQRGAALAQYEACRRVLADELGVEPDAKTVALHQQIQAGELEAPVSAPLALVLSEIEIKYRLPAFLETQREDPPRPVFVARERELERLDSFLETALNGKGQVVFITGGPGRGKTALMAEFARRAMATHPDLLVASGSCSAYSGVGDPYLPFRDVMAMLTGDVESLWASGGISRDHALRLWEALPQVVQALRNSGPHLTDALVPGPDLLARAAVCAPAGAPWLEPLRARVERRRSGREEIEQSHLFQQATNVLRELSLAHPLVLTLDDLQWADAASIGLLFHLGRRIGTTGSRILIVGAYRPEEVAFGQDDARHPLEKVLTEFKRTFGDVFVDLAQAEESESHAFVDAFLDTEGNRLGEGFRQALFQHTGGHALFTIELLRAMQERGDVVRDEAGLWIEAPTLDWETLPPRVEAVIEERVGRLEEGLRDILSVASVEGESFTAQVVARVQEVGERQTLHKLSLELGKRHRLVREQGALPVGRQRLSQYRFAHALFQQYLYNGLGAGERALLHGQVAGALEDLYGSAGRVQDVAVQLAHHYDEAGDDERAQEYYTLAGDVALGVFAHAEAEGHFRRGLELAHRDAERAHLLSGLGAALAGQGRFREAIETWTEPIVLYRTLGEGDHVARLYTRASEAAWDAGDPRESLRLCEEGLAAVAGAPDSIGVACLLHEAARAYCLNLLVHKAWPLNQQAMQMAERLGDAKVLTEALTTKGTFMQLGDNGIATLLKALELAESHGLVREAARAHTNLGACKAPWLGDYRAGVDHMRRAAELWQDVGHTASQIFVLDNVAGYSMYLGEFEEAEGTLDRIRQLLMDVPESSQAAAHFHTMATRLLRLRGCWSDCAARARADQADARGRGDVEEQALAGISLAVAVVESYLLAGDPVGDLDEAEAALVFGVETSERSPQFAGVDMRVWLGFIYIIRGRLRDARRVLDAAQDAAGEPPSAHDMPYVLWLRARLSAAEAHWEKALADFEETAACFSRTERRWHWARALLDWAEAYTTHGEPGDAERARELLCEAQAAFEEMSISRYAAVAQERLDALDQRRQPA